MTNNEKKSLSVIDKIYRQYGINERKVYRSNQLEISERKRKLQEQKQIAYTLRSIEIAKQLFP